MSISQKTPSFGHSMLELFHLDPSIAHLNHGSYGATPREVIADQQDWQIRMEREPSGFMEREFRPGLRAAAERLGQYLNAAPEQIALVENATSGANAVLRGLPLQSGDEILITDQTYGAVRNSAQYVCERTGASLVVSDLPFPVIDAEQFLAAFVKGLTPRTRIAIIDHITSPTALLLPLKEMIAAARKVGALILVDGAHAPGMVPLDVTGLDVDWYTGNCHKWLYAPKGCAFLWSAKKHLDTTHPLTISHGYEGGFIAEFDWVGTRDGTSQLALPAAFDFRERFGDAEIQAHNRTLARSAAEMLAADWQTETGAPAEMSGSMAIVRLPDKFTATNQRAVDLRAELLDRHQIQIPVRAIDGSIWVRISAQIYNQTSDYERLARVIHEING